ncbi:hepatitis A virus cellular receptor 2 isoform X2 [Camelus dromedarius]|uniref:Hepatitis A virus cellular receptor 2 isoform X2 n=1 Tax=Camelus ferus TaxID=419612 RepID=A0A8B7K4L3_CAMFR|nr:hepatitis A virus cellular receptor 2 isoform X2 [Camelus ferus]XP_031305268.1 hepatitis A virus cellular receptor 2 isoform X2 [Camelus dromedarius]
MLSHLSFDCVLFLLLQLTRSPEGVYVAEVGQNADLPCVYSPATPENSVPVCWGKGPCPVFGCYNMVLNTDGRNVKYRISGRYLLKRDFLKGDVTLTIKNVTLADHGTYCCRIQFPGPLNDQKSNLELVIRPETQTLETLRDKNQTEIPTLASELQDVSATTRTSLYIGAGVSAGLALILVAGVFILKWYSDSKKKLQNSSLITLANRPPLGLTNTVAERMRSEENIYVIEENVYEMEDPYEYCCDASSGQQP